MFKSTNLLKEVIKRTNTVPNPDFSNAQKDENGKKLAQQLDVALMSIGFKMSKDLLDLFGSINPITLTDYASTVLQAAGEMVGDDVEHNVYFKEFPNNVPDTLDFWVEQIVKWFLTGTNEYGRYQHTYEEMLRYHDEFIGSNKDKMTILHLGDTLAVEVHKLYLSLAGSNVPLKDKDRVLLKDVAELCLNSEQPEKIPARENKAIINMIRLENDKDLLVDTVTDVLRLACVISGGDETLLEKTIFKSIPRKTRKLFMLTLDKLLVQNPNKLEDVLAHKEAWKKLGEKVHPKEYQKYSFAQDVFAVARSDKKLKSFTGKVEYAFSKNDLTAVLNLLFTKPGIFFRNIDRILTMCGDSTEAFNKVVGTVKRIAPAVSSRVIVSVLEHLRTRTSENTTAKRIFINKKGKSWITDDNRKPLNADECFNLSIALDTELTNRVSDKLATVVYGAAVETLALPLSDKGNPGGFSVVPRGSYQNLGNFDTLRFFCYWKEKRNRTDFDLSLQMLDENFESVGHVSYTRLQSSGIVHSGDITSSPNGATEFMDVKIDKINKDCKYIVPVVYVFSGESFEEVKESYFGYMLMDEEQKGKPFEPAAVRMKSDVRGKGKASVPAIFEKNENGTWDVKWTHLYLTGHPWFNRIEITNKSLSLITKNIMAKSYFTIGDLLGILMEGAEEVAEYDPERVYGGPVTYIGMERPEGLPDGSTVYTLNNLHELVGLISK